MQTHSWVVQIIGENVVCWRCNGTIPESKEFPIGTICGEGVAYDYPYNSEPDCTGKDCINPTGAEGSTKCINGYMHTCQEGQWIKNIPEEPCGEELCAQYKSQSECENAGCYWYAYPNPFGEQQCFGKPIFIQYLPIIAIGIGALIVIATVLKKKQKVMAFAMPPLPYPPGRY